MSADVVARGLAIAAARKTGVSPLAFADLPTQTIPAGVNAITVTVGSHAAVAVADALASAALAAAHPRFCKADAAGRHFRLVADNGAISVELGGAVGQAGVNDRPAFQATIDYAYAAGIRRVIMTRPSYELWASVRTQSPHAAPYSDDGHCLVMRGGLTLEGVGVKPVLTRRNATGGDPTVKTHYNFGGTSFYLRGGGIYFSHDGSFGANVRTALRNFIFDGSCERSMSGTPDDYATYEITYNDNDGWDLWDKGIWIQDMAMGHLDMADVEIRRFRGELFYGLGAGNSVHGRDCKFHTGNADADNSFVGTALWERCEFGNTFQGAETRSGDGGHTYRHCLFYDCTGGSSFGFGNDHPVANFLDPTRDTAEPIPWTTFDDCEFRNASINVGDWVRGTVKLVDSRISILTPAFGNVGPKHIQLTIDAVADRRTPGALVFMEGALANIKILVRSCMRSAFAVAQNHRYTALFEGRGAWDHGSMVLSAADGCEAEAFWVGYGAGFAETPNIPLLVRPRTFAPYFDKFVYVEANTTINAGYLHYLFYNASGSAKSVSIDATLQHAHGQRIRMLAMQNATPTSPLTFAKTGAGMMLSADRTLYRGGEWLELEWDATLSKWTEAGYFSQGAP